MAITSRRFGTIPARPSKDVIHVSVRAAPYARFLRHSGLHLLREFLNHGDDARQDGAAHPQVAAFNLRPSK
jgi:hypothetical protein